MKLASVFAPMIVSLVIILILYLYGWIIDFSSFFLVSCLSLILQKGLFKLFELIYKIINKFPAKFSNKRKSPALENVPQSSRGSIKGDIQRLSGLNDEMRQAYKSMVCPLSKNLMREPMKTKCCGVSFEGHELVSYLQLYRSCPNCLEKANRGNVSRNLYLRTQIEIFKHKMGQKAQELKGTSEINAIVID